MSSSSQSSKTCLSAPGIKSIEVLFSVFFAIGFEAGELLKRCVQRLYAPLHKVFMAIAQRNVIRMYTLKDSEQLCRGLEACSR